MSHGLMITRGQVENVGHVALKKIMLSSCEINSIGFGSCEKFGTHSNPFTYEDKKFFHSVHWADKFNVFRLEDIGCANGDEWMYYVLQRMREEGLPEPTDFFAGSEQEARWYTGYFGEMINPVQMENHVVYETNGKRIHILNRYNIQYDGEVISSSLVRADIEKRGNDWKKFVPEILHDAIEERYPPHLRIPVIFNGNFGYPVGTRLLISKNDINKNNNVFGSGVIESLDNIMDDMIMVIKRADGKYRIFRDESNIKSLGD